MFKSPTNIKEYWTIVDDHWNYLQHILNIYLNTSSKQWIDGSPLNVVDNNLGDYLLHLKQTKNPRLVRAFNAAWFNCPEENSGEWAHQAWNVLCVLCSEEWCLHEEKEEDDES